MTYGAGLGVKTLCRDRRKRDWTFGKMVDMGLGHGEVIGTMRE